MNEQIEKATRIALDRVATMSDDEVRCPIMGHFGNVCLRMQYYNRKGAVHKGHKHTHDHMSLVVCGSVSVTVGDSKGVVHKAPTFFEVPKDVFHTIEALESGTTVYCIYAVYDEETGAMAKDAMEVQRLQEKGSLLVGGVNKKGVVKPTALKTITPEMSIEKRRKSHKIVSPMMKPTDFLVK